MITGTMVWETGMSPLIDPTNSRQREILMELEEIRKRIERIEKLLETINLRLAARP